MNFKLIYSIIFLSILLGIDNYSYAKLLIITPSYNRPDFIEIQYKTFKKFLKDEYEFVVFNDAPGQDMCNQIINMCAGLGIRCVRVPQEIHARPYLQRWPQENYNDPAVRNANVVQYSLDTFGFAHDDIFMTLDSDMFLVKEFSVRKYLGDHVIAGIPQKKGKIDYIWIGLVFLDLANLPDKTTLSFNCGRVEEQSVDAGGFTYHYFKNHPDVKNKIIRHMHLDARGIPSYGINDQWQSDNSLLCDICHKLACMHNEELLKQKFNLDTKAINFLKSGVTRLDFLCDGMFVHYSSGTNWNNESENYHRNKTMLFNSYIDNLLK